MLQAKRSPHRVGRMAAGLPNRLGAGELIRIMVWAYLGRAGAVQYNQSFAESLQGPEPIF